MKKNFVEEMEKEVVRVKEYIPPIAILITADAGAGQPAEQRHQVHTARLPHPAHRPKRGAVGPLCGGR